MSKWIYTLMQGSIVLFSLVSTSGERYTSQRSLRKAFPAIAFLLRSLIIQLSTLAFGRISGIDYEGVTLPFRPCDADGQ
ncbi:hypothetical protein F5141DRAFT_1107615 [Pisolithus sp. B1]|nr:hypothetical protein F5141DRAFT_1107615 [Pisolithus sp. B1]